jgi:hypothetical protein
MARKEFELASAERQVFGHAGERELRDDQRSDDLHRPQHP